MAKSSNFNTCFLLLALLVSSIFTNPASCVDPATQSLIDKICRQMEQYGFCNDTFHKNIKGETADMTALAQIAIGQTLIISKDIHDFVVDLLNKTTDQAEKNALIVCENAYSIVLNLFQQASDAFNTKDYDSMLTLERQAPRAQASCTIIYDTPPNPPNLVGNRNVHARILIAMSVVTGIELNSRSV